ncbi:MAG: hypothetical protein K8R23_17065, partial [Chthoniobacter sp.]|nr:hypothetical protein [Chthoniobacter sp.]
FTPHPLCASLSIPIICSSLNLLFFIRSALLPSRTIFFPRPLFRAQVSGTAGADTLGTGIITGGLVFTNTSGTYTVAGGASNYALDLLGAVTISTASGGGASITAPLVVNGSTITMTLASALSISQLIADGNGTTPLSPST